MSSPAILAAASAVCLAAAVIAADARAGASAYDISLLLGSPHPFADTPAALPEVGTPLYEAQIRAPARFPQSRPSYASTAREAAQPSLLQRMGLAAGPDEIASDRPADPAHVSFSAGWYDFNDAWDAGEFRIEWRGSPWVWGIRPLAGLMATSDVAAYGYGGVALDLYFGRRIVVTPSFAAGLYHDGDGKDLGSAVEFRSGLEVGWRFDDRSRISVILYHLSNAGISDTNPGTEVISVGYAFPIW